MACSVRTSIAAAPDTCGASLVPIRPDSSSAASRLKVIAQMRCAVTPRPSSTPSRATSVVVLPLPAGAMTSAGPSGSSAAARCSGSSDASRPSAAGAAVDGAIGIPAGWRQPIIGGSTMAYHLRSARRCRLRSSDGGCQVEKSVRSSDGIPGRLSWPEASHLAPQSGTYSRRLRVFVTFVIRIRRRS